MIYWILGIVAFLAVVVIFYVVKERKFQTLARELEAQRKAKIKNSIAPGVRFIAYGGFGTRLSGVCIRIIDANTIEALVGRADGGPREQGPFPISNIDSIE